MKLPHPENAIIPEKKLTDYLLSKTHETGRFKAKFFRSLGFNEENLNLLEKEFLNIVQTQEITKQENSEFGIKYIIDGSLMTPLGKSVKIRTVWIVENDEEQPIFITAYPV